MCAYKNTTAHKSVHDESLSVKLIMPFALRAAFKKRKTESLNLTILKILSVCDEETLNKFIDLVNTRSDYINTRMHTDSISSALTFLRLLDQSICQHRSLSTLKH